jgi:hypothetical protein
VTVDLIKVHLLKVDLREAVGAGIHDGHLRRNRRPKAQEDKANGSKQAPACLEYPERRNGPHRSTPANDVQDYMSATH